MALIEEMAARQADRPILWGALATILEDIHAGDGAEMIDRFLEGSQ